MYFQEVGKVRYTLCSVIFTVMNFQNLPIFKLSFWVQILTGIHRVGHVNYFVEIPMLLSHPKLEICMMQLWSISLYKYTVNWPLLYLENCLTYEFHSFVYHLCPLLWACVANFIMIWCFTYHIWAWQIYTCYPMIINWPKPDQLRPLHYYIVI